MERKHVQLVDNSASSIADQIRRLRQEVNFIKGSLSQSGGAFLGQGLAATGEMRTVSEFQKTVFMPQGNDGHDQLMLELVDHPFPVEQMTIFCRPTIQSHPVEMLRKLGASENKIYRTMLCLAAYKSGRMKYTEILSKQKLWALLNYCPEQKFYSYRCSDITIDDVERHLDHLLELVDSANGYQLVFSEVNVPIYFATFEVIQPQAIESWTVMTADQSQAEHFKPSSFVIRDVSFLRGLKNSVFDMVWRDSSTIADRRDVVAELLKIKQYLRDNGPFETTPTAAISKGENGFLT